MARLAVRKVILGNTKGEDVSMLTKYLVHLIDFLLFFYN